MQFWDIKIVDLILVKETTLVIVVPLWSINAVCWSEFGSSNKKSEKTESTQVGLSLTGYMWPAHPSHLGQFNWYWSQYAPVSFTFIYFLEAGASIKRRAAPWTGHEFITATQRQTMSSHSFIQTYGQFRVAFAPTMLLVHWRKLEDTQKTHPSTERKY